MKHHLMGMETFTGTQADKSFVYTPEFIVQLPSAVTLSIKISVPLRMAYMPKP